MFNCLIVDDELYARKEMVYLLKPFSQINNIFEAHSVDSAEQIICNNQIDLIFLDIQLMGETGFDLLERVEVKGQVVFVTAFDNYAIQAFEVNAVDYLLKPVNTERFNKTMGKIFQQNTSEKIYQYSENDHLIAKTMNGLKVVKIKNISYISAEGDYTEVKSIDGKSFLILRTMKQWEQILPETCFQRIHRSTIVNLNQIEYCDKVSSNQFTMKLLGFDKMFSVSRIYYKKMINTV